MDHNPPLLTVRNLEVSFAGRHGKLVAIDDVSFDIYHGEVLGVVGESGAGKSLTGQAIVGLLEPPGQITGGEIRLNGERLDTLAHKKMNKLRGARIGMIFQDPLTSLNPLFPIGEQIVETILTHLDMNKEAARNRALTLLEEVGLPAARDCLNAYPHQLSGGMRQRVVIALTLCADPDLVIADEPTTALDVSVQAQVIRVLKRACAERGTAIMLITHDMGVIAEMADRVAVMYAGRIAEVGAVSDVVHRPIHPYTIGLMGTIPKLDEDQDSLVQIPGAMPRLTAMPHGCRFHPRCPHTFERCSNALPNLMIANGRQTACWLWSSDEEERRRGVFLTRENGND